MKNPAWSFFSMKGRHKTCPYFRSMGVACCAPTSSIPPSLQYSIFPLPRFLASSLPRFYAHSILLPFREFSAMTISDSDGSAMKKLVDRFPISFK